MMFSLNVTGGVGASLCTGKLFPDAIGQSLFREDQPGRVKVCPEAARTVLNFIYVIHTKYQQHRWNTHCNILTLTLGVGRP